MSGVGAYPCGRPWPARQGDRKGTPLPEFPGPISPTVCGAELCMLQSNVVRVEPAPVKQRRCGATPN